jgi:hypothetical protein
MIKIIKNIQALSTFKQNRLSQKLSKLRVALVGAEVDIAELNRSSTRWISWFFKRL